MIVLVSRMSLNNLDWFSYRYIYRRCSSKLGTVFCDAKGEFLPKLEERSALDPTSRIESVKDKIIYSSVLHKHQLLNWKQVQGLLRKQAATLRKEKYEASKKNIFPIALKYIEGATLKNESTLDTTIVTNNLHLPVESTDRAALTFFGDVAGMESISEMEMSVTVDTSTTKSLEPRENKELTKLSHFRRNLFCSGCGAHIQCEDQYNPGFIPLEFLTSLNKKQLSLLLCQRCYITRSLKIPLQVHFNPEGYLKNLKHLKFRRSLILAVFDVTDIGNGICSSISDFVGKGHPVILVGNKIDLLPPDQNGYVSRIRKQLKSYFESNGHLQVKDVFLVSCASGIGIEDLISALFTSWKNYGDVYLVGHTNVGKSSLFNVLLNSDFCKPQYTSKIQSATTSPWPGTTLGVLKFPITRPTGSFMVYRTKRLQHEIAERKLKKLEESHQKKIGFIASPDHVVASSPEDIRCDMGTNEVVGHTVAALDLQKLALLGVKISKFNHEDMMRWCHDIPGIPTTSRVLDLLTPDEVKCALPDSGMIIPRTLYFKVGLSLFVGGLARVDYYSGECPIRITVFASNKIPIVLCSTVDAEEIYSALLGTSLFLVPYGGQERLKHWPPLVPKDYEVTGLGKKESCADILLSSAGWVAITPEKGMACSLRAHTPGGLGIDLRTPPLLPYSVLQKGPRRKNSLVHPKLRDHMFTKFS